MEYGAGEQGEGKERERERERERESARQREGGRCRDYSICSSPSGLTWCRNCTPRPKVGSRVNCRTEVAVGALSTLGGQYSFVV